MKNPHPGFATPLPFAKPKGRGGRILLGPKEADTADKNQSSRHIPCAVHLVCQEILKSGRHDGACLLLLSALSERVAMQVPCTEKVRCGGSWLVVGCVHKKTHSETAGSSVALSWHRNNLSSIKPSVAKHPILRK
jgi:hypothetical protein